jgi:hypothetical protein
MAMPSREEFKRQIEIQRVEITLKMSDLLEWNATNQVTNISAMNKMIRTRMPQEATKAPASQARTSTFCYPEQRARDDTVDVHKISCYLYALNTNQPS